MTTFDIPGGGVYTVRSRVSQLRRAWRIAANHAFARHRAHEIMSLKVAFHMFVQFVGVYSTTNPTQGSGCETEYVWGTCQDLNPA